MTNRLAPSAFLGEPLTGGYVPTLIYTQNILFDQGKYFTLWDVERMRRDYRCQFGIRILRAPIFTAIWNVEATDPAAKQCIEETLDRFWHGGSLLHALTHLEYGALGGEPIYRLSAETGEIEFDYLKPLHLFDLRPRELRGRLTGISVRNIRDKNENYVRLRPPKCFYLVNEPDFNPFWGKSRYYAAWEQWQEKTARHGARDIRRLWYSKNAHRGMRMRHPMGTIDVAVPGGGTMFHTCQDYAREIVEKAEAGHVMALPNSFNKETGKYQWEVEDAEVGGPLVDVREYLKDLDREILEGMGIPQEIVQAGEGGGMGSYGGRAVPALMFYTSEDQIVDAVIRSIEEWIIRPLLKVNGYSDEFTIRAVSLVPKGNEGQPGPGEGETPGQGPTPAAGSRPTPPPRNPTPRQLEPRLPEPGRRLSAEGDPVTVYLVRHGTTKLNDETNDSVDKIRGWSNVPLTDDGRAEARAVASDLADVGIEVIVASDLDRAAETAQIIGEALGIEPILSKGLRPWNVGNITGTKTKEALPKIAEYARNKPDEKIPDGESFTEFSERVFAGVADAIDQAAGKQLLIVAHHRVDRLLAAWDDAGQPADHSINLDIFLDKGVPPGGADKLDIDVGALTGPGGGQALSCEECGGPVKWLADGCGWRCATPPCEWVRMSGGEEPDRADTESVSPLVDTIIDRGMTAGLVVSEEIRRKVRQAVADLQKKKSRDNR